MVSASPQLLLLSIAELKINRDFSLFMMANPLLLLRFLTFCVTVSLLFGKVIGTVTRLVQWIAEPLIGTVLVQFGTVDQAASPFQGKYMSSYEYTQLYAQILIDVRFSGNKVLEHARNVRFHRTCELFSCYW